MFKKLAAAILSTMLACTLPAEASDTTGTGTITEIWAIGNGALLFNVTVSRTTPPACSGAGSDHRFAIDASTTAGQALASSLLLAYSLGKQVFVAGTGSCTIWSDVETVLMIYIKP